jgi:DNA excision repair protein ERCC-4
VVEAMLKDISRGRFVSKMKPQSALQSVIAMQVRNKVPFMFCGDRSGAQYFTHGLLSKYPSEIGKQ